MARKRRGGSSRSDFAGLSRSARAAGHGGGATGKGRGWKKGIEDPKLRAAIADVVRKAMTRFARGIRSEAKKEVARAGRELRNELKRELGSAGVKGDGFSVSNGLVGGGARASDRAAVGPSSRTAGHVVARAAIDVAEGAGGENLLKHAVSRIGGRAAHTAGAAALGALGGPLGILVAAALPILVEQLAPRFGEFLADKLTESEDKLRAEFARTIAARLDAALLEVDFERQARRSTKLEQGQLDKAFERVLELDPDGLMHRDGAILEGGG